MSNIKKVRNEFEILELEDKELFSIKNKEEIIKVYDQELLEKIIDNTFNKKYRKLLYLIMSVNEDEDSTDTDAELALLKIEDLKKYIMLHYSELISKRLLNKYLKMLMILENKIEFNKKRGKSR